MERSFKMKIKLVKNLPVEGIHGMNEGRILEVLEHDRDGVWVKGDAGTKVKVLKREYDVQPENTETI